MSIFGLFVHFCARVVELTCLTAPYVL